MRCDIPGLTEKLGESFGNKRNVQMTMFLEQLIMDTIHELELQQQDIDALKQENKKLKEEITDQQRV